MTSEDDTTAHAAEAVSVLGLGAMGSAIARTFTERGFRTTVWNRTPSRADPVVRAGATAATSAAAATTASPVVVICLLDARAVQEVLDAIGDAAAGRTLVNVTSGSPAQARATEQWARSHGADYVDGTIMGDPPYIGTPNVRFSFSGSPEAFTRYESVLGQLGTATHYGEDAGAAAVEFMAQVAVGYEFLIGFLHTLRLVQAEGFDLEAFADRVAGSLSGYAELLTMFATAVESGEYGPDLGSLDVQAALMDDLISHRESVGVETVRMREVKGLMDRRIIQGHGDQGFSSLFELLGRE